MRIRTTARPRAGIFPLVTLAAALALGGCDLRFADLGEYLDYRAFVGEAPVLVDGARYAAGRTLVVELDQSVTAYAWRCAAGGSAAVTAEASFLRAPNAPGTGCLRVWKVLLGPAGSATLDFALVKVSAPGDVADTRSYTVTVE